jgi:pimeloyl-ACP methyl ester carboxylesterase
MSQIVTPPIGQLVKVNGHRLHMIAAGEGSPTVVFESGGASWSLDWHLVQTGAASVTSTCAYDRAGFGWSDPGPAPRTSQQIARELHAMLTAADLPKPYILVGASAGGHIVRLLAKQFPDEVAGMVLLDARHESLDEKMPPAWHKLEKTGLNMYRFMHLAARMGALKTLGRLMGEKAAPPILMKLPPELRVAYLEVGFQPKFFQSNLDEFAAIAESDAQLHSAGSLGNLPLTVIRHGLPEMFASMPAGQAAQAEQVWQELQAELAGLSTNSRMLAAGKSGHRIQMDQPELVVDAILQMVEMIRRCSHTVL